MVEVGNRIKLVGLKMAKYNDMLGWIAKVYPEQGKVKVALDNGQTFKVKVENVVVGRPAPPPSDSELNTILGFMHDANVETHPEADGSLSFTRRE